jgi:DnaJ-class molecular chaperone
MPHKCETCKGTGIDPNPYCNLLKMNPETMAYTYARSTCWDCHGLGYKIKPKYQ